MVCRGIGATYPEMPKLKEEKVHIQKPFPGYFLIWQFNKYNRIWSIQRGNYNVRIS